MDLARPTVYAFLTSTSLDLYEATYDIKWLRRAVELDKTLEQFFEDKRAGGFFMTSSDHEKLLARENPPMTVPSHPETPLLC